MGLKDIFNIIKFHVTKNNKCILVTKHDNKIFLTHRIKKENHIQNNKAHYTITIKIDR